VARAFVAEFLLPLVRGGTLLVGRPLSFRDVRALMQVTGERPTTEEREAASSLGRARRECLSSLVPTAPELTLDEPTWRLGAAVHNLLALAHPRIATGPGADARIQRVADAAAQLARLGAPDSLAAALARHSLVARLPEIQRRDHTVRFWLGTRTFVGRPPPPRMLALPRVRGVRVESVRRTWLRDVGIHALARPAFIALTEASPFGEALDPWRLDPPVSWARLLSVLRFPALARLVAGRIVELGVAGAGDALAEAAYRFGSLQDAAGSVRASPQAVAFALAFLAHTVWLDHLFDPAGAFTGASARGRRPGRGSGPVVTAASDSGGMPAAAGGGRELAVLLAAAAQVSPDLIWPPDVPRASTLGQEFARALVRTFDRHQVEKSPRWPAALELANLAARTTDHPAPEPRTMGYKERVQDDGP
jgi:hypothetical protein